MYCGGVLPRNSLNYIAAASAIGGFFGGGYAEQFWGFTRNKLGVYTEQTGGLRVGAALIYRTGDDDEKARERWRVVCRSGWWEIRKDVARLMTCTILYEYTQGMNSVVCEQDPSYLDSTSPNTGYLYAPDHGPDSVSAYITCNTPHSVHSLLERRFPPRPPQPTRPM